MSSRRDAVSPIGRTKRNSLPAQPGGRKPKPAASRYASSSECVGDATRERLLAVAAKHFARHGFSGTSVRDLAQAAKVNVAAISYHFGGKQSLYRECLRHHFLRSQVFWDAARQRQQQAADVGTPAAAENAIRIHIQQFLAMLFREDTAFTLMMRELIEPSEALRKVVVEFIQPNSSVLLALAGQVRPDLKGSPRLQVCCRSMVGLCVNLRTMRAIVAQLNQRDHLDAAFIESSALQIASVSLAALHDRREW